MIARADEIGRREARQPCGGEPADELRVDPVIALFDERVDAVQAVPQLAHLAQIREADAVLRGANELGQTRPRVALLRQLVEEREPDVRARQQALVAWRGSLEPSLRELRGKARIRRERKRPCADAVADDALEGEGARVTPHGELHRSTRSQELRRHNSLEALHVDGGSMQSVIVCESYLHPPGLSGRTDRPRARQ